MRTTHLELRPEQLGPSVDRAQSLAEAHWCTEIQRGSWGQRGQSGDNAGGSNTAVAAAAAAAAAAASIRSKRSKAAAAAAAAVAAASSSRQQAGNSSSGLKNDETCGSERVDALSRPAAIQISSPCPNASFTARW